jgi:CRISPR/Cas system-associated protein Cas5 (RAMP superfamily)
MGERLDRIKQNERNRQAANKLMSEMNEAHSKTDISVTNLDFNKYEDQKIVLQILLRGKTEDEYFSIVDGLFTGYDNTKDKKEKDKLHNLASQVMSVGGENLGIDWS